MAYFALFYEFVDNFVARRAPYREEHLRLVREAHARGEAVLAGALADPADRGLLVLRANERTRAEDFARNDPYVANGLVTRWEVRPWTVVVGNEESKKSAAPVATPVTRVWSARTTDAQLGAYLAHFAGTVLPKLRTLSGFLGATVLTRRTAGDVEILVTTLWQSLDAIRQFAGSDIEAAVVGKEAAMLLTDFDGRVRHYQTAIASSSG